MISRPLARLFALLATIALAVPVLPAAAQQASPIDVKITWDKPGYESGDLITATVTMTNTSAADVEQIKVKDFVSGTQLKYNPASDWDEFGIFSPGGTIRRGESRTFTLIGHNPQAEGTEVDLAGDLFSVVTGHTLGHFYSKAPITKTYGTVNGVTYMDRNTNARFDEGEIRPNTKVVLDYPYSGDQYETTSDATGHFSMTIPAVEYDVFSTETEDGWTTTGPRFRVTKSGVTDLKVRTVRPMKELLDASITFDEHQYRVGDVAHLTVTFNNKTDNPIVRVVAYCNTLGDDFSLFGHGDGWGDLDTAKGGMILRPGKTVLKVTDLVVPNAQTVGVLRVECNFGFAGLSDYFNNPEWTDDADVPGGFGGLEGTMVYQSGADDEPVPGVRVVLLDKRSCVLGERTTDSNGKFVFDHLPAGLWGAFPLYMFPPDGWMMRQENPDRDLHISEGEITTQTYRVFKGSGQVPVIPAQPAECTTKPTSTTPTTSTSTTTSQSTSSTQPMSSSSSSTTTQTTTPTTTEPAPQAKGLAHTGANVQPPMLFGVAALMLGIGLVLATRRRPRKQ